MAFKENDFDSGILKSPTPLPPWIRGIFTSVFVVLGLVVLGSILISQINDDSETAEVGVENVGYTTEEAQQLVAGIRDRAAQLEANESDEPTSEPEIDLGLVGQVSDAKAGVAEAVREFEAGEISADEAYKQAAQAAAGLLQIPFPELTASDVNQVLRDLEAMERVALMDFEYLTGRARELATDLTDQATGRSEDLVMDGVATEAVKAIRDVAANADLNPQYVFDRGRDAATAEIIAERELTRAVQAAESLVDNETVLLLF